MSSPEEPHRPVPPQPGHEPAAGHSAPGQPPVPYYSAPPGPPGNGAPPNYPPPGYPPPANGAPPYYGDPGQPPPKKSRKALWIVLGIVGGVLLLVAAGVVILLNVVGGATNQARGLADEFTKLIIAGDVNGAYEKYLDPALMEKLSREEFAAGVQSLELDGSCKPNFSSLNVSSDNGANTADVAGAIDCDTKSVDLVYRFEGRDELKMVKIRLRPQG
ncbi:hypothetical protein SAMN04487916_102141 [Arthrobacter sp. ov407]|uniref:hypothetical protein n=1 Tax=Arthrobacter sp. ov407 TaxID=1761748 RepID=UPI00088AF19F|nr:hypothetical protein [Arthrobacter sp. ov407]SDK68054.1 hypothetical protein SAMN04487916_102141 [Arthrobacter sp. ov407]